MNLAKYVVALEAQSAQYVAELQKANTQLKKFHEDQTQALDGIKSAFTELAGFLSAGMFVKFVKDAVEANSRLYDLSQRLGTTTEYLSAMRFAVKQNGADFESFTNTIQMMERQIGLAASGISTKAVKAFEELNLSVEKLTKVSPETAYAAIVQRLSEISDQSTRAAVASRIFGDGMIAMQFAAQGGATALANAMEKAKEFGVVVSQDAAKASKDATDAIEEMKAALEGLSNAVIPKAIGWLEKFAEGLRKAFFATELEKLNQQIAETEGALGEMQKKIKELYKRQDAGETPLPFGMGSFTPAINELIARISEAHKQLELLIAARDRLAGGGKGGAGGAGGGLNAAYGGILQHGDEFASLNANIAGQTGGIPPPLLARAGTPGSPYGPGGSMNFFGSIDDVIKAGIAKRKQEEQSFTEWYKKEWLIRQRADMDAWNAQLEAEKTVTDQRVAMQQGAVGAIVGLLETLGAKHRGAAIAAILIEKGIAMARIIINTHVAVMNAMATLPYPANIAAAAAVRVLGFTEAAAVGATALAQAAQLSSGGTGPATLGTAANPITTTSASQAATGSAQAQQKNSVQIIFQGDVFGWDETMKKRIVDSLRDLIDNKDVVIIGQGSRQALQLTGG